MEKDLERQSGINWNFINENNRKIGEKEGGRSHVACEEEIEGKIMENEENICLINKKAYEDQLVPFFSSFWELSHYYLSFSLILLHT